MSDHDRLVWNARQGVGFSLLKNPPTHCLDMLPESWFLGLLVLLIVAFYFNSLDGDFVWDDRAAIVSYSCSLHKTALMTESNTGEQ